MNLLLLIIQYILDLLRARQTRITLDTQLKTALSKGSAVHHQYCSFGCIQTRKKNHEV